MTEPAPPTPYERFGGAPFFDALTARFYEGVVTDPVLRPMYPDDDLPGAQERLRMFLTQYWGGPKTYGEQRGHPRLRMRHAPYPITPQARDRWLHHMRVAVEEAHLPRPDEDELWTYLVTAAHAMVNTFDDPPSGMPTLSIG